MEELNERDFVTFEDDEGNKIELDIVQYFEYDGDEYAILADFSDADDEVDVETQEFMVLKIVENDDETEEFVNPDEDKMDALAEVAEKILYAMCECDDDCDCDCGCHGGDDQ